MKLIIFIMICVLNLIQAQDGNELSFAVEGISEARMIFYPLPIKATITNSGLKQQVLLKPSMNGGNLIVNTRFNNEELHAHRHKSLLYMEELKLDPGESYSWDMDLRDMYGELNDSGIYTCQLIYHLKNGSTLSTENFSFELLPLDDIESEAFENFKEVMRFFEWKGIEEGNAFLEKYPTSIFANTVRKKVGDIYRRSKKYDESIPYYKAIKASPLATASEKSDGTFYQALAEYSKGDMENAKSTLRNGKFSNPSQIIRDWTPIADKESRN